MEHQRIPVRFLVALALSAVSAAATVTASERELAGTEWQLVEIAEMDDSTHRPDDPGRYTLSFGEDHGVHIRADCNQATGSWSSDEAGQLQFGALAATQALCPPGSLHDQYLMQFEWVRSYVLEDGHLFLATMADGAIIEFAPLDSDPDEPRAAATVFGEPVYAEDAETMQSEILSRVFARYAEERGLAASDEEITAYRADFERAMAEDRAKRQDRAATLRARLRDEELPEPEREKLAAELEIVEGSLASATDDLTAEEEAELEGMQAEMARSMVSRWKLNQALHEQYGGRIIFQQFGPEPLDAYRKHLEALERSGDLKIRRVEWADGFWRYFTDDSMHSFYPAGSEEARSAFAVPPWERRIEANHTLAGTAWVLAEIGGGRPDGDVTMTLRFGDDRAGGSDGCNRFLANFEEAGDALTMDMRGPSTMMACPPSVAVQAAAYRSALADTRSARRIGDRLELRDASGSALAVFTAQDTSLVGTSWEVTGYNDGDGGFRSLVSGTALSLGFGDAGRLTGSAGCNRLNASWERDGASVTIGPAAATRRLCPQPEGIMEQESAFLAALQGTHAVTFEGDGVEFRNDEGALQFAATRLPLVTVPPAPQSSDDALAARIARWLRDDALADDLAAMDDASRRFQYFATDLNGDGRNEIMIHLMGRWFCGSGGCTFLLVDPDFELITRFTVMRPPIWAEKNPDGPWKLLLVRSEGDLKELRYENGSYPPNPSVVPKAPYDAASGHALIMFDEDFAPARSYRF